MKPMRIVRATVTPVAFRDPPLLNVWGVHEPWALRSVIELEADNGLVGLGESYGDSRALANLDACRDLLVGADPHRTGELARAIAARLGSAGGGFIGVPGDAQHGPAANAFAAFEVACLDLQAQAAGVPVSDLLGGAVRRDVAYSAYLFYKFGAHIDGGPDDGWGEAIDPAGLVAQAATMVDRYGFGSLKLKGGVFAPEVEIETMEALRARFPTLPLRIDPNGGWTVETSIRAARALSGTLEYLEDPAPGLDALGQVAKGIDMPIATNMYVTGFSDIPRALELGAVQVILADHHYWGGLRASAELARICATFGLGLSMHSNSHLGISLMAMTQLACTVPNLTYACDTHYPWQVEDVIAGPRIEFHAGSVRVPEGPGLGVTLDRDRLAALHENYRTCGIRDRDDSGYMRRYRPDWVRKLPRF